MVDIKAIQAAIDRLKVGHMTEASCEALVTRLERAIQDVPICTVPHNCDMLEEHITGGGEHSNIEERLCCLEAAAELAQEKIKALESFQAFADNALRDLMGLNASEQKSEVATSTAALPEGAQVTQTASAENRCAQCNRPLSTEFGATYRTDAIPGEVYCSAQCGWEAATDRLERPQARQCDQCGADIEVLYETHLLPKRMFCSWECTTIAADRPKLALMSDDDPTPEYRGPRCDRCNAPLGFNAYSSGATPGKTFCGPECAWKAEIEQRLSSLEKHEKCLQCNGLGFVVVGQEISLTGTTVDIQTCQRCGGTGRL